MAEEENDAGSNSGGGGNSSTGNPPPKCPPCPLGLPGWMATYSDMVTLLLTFFVLLLSFAKTETAKYEAAMGSIRNAFGGNVLKHGEVIQRGKSPDNSPTMLESPDVIRPFPIEFLTMEGLLDKHEINRQSEEELQDMKQILVNHQLSDMVIIEEISEGIKVTMKDKIYFQLGTVKIEKISMESFERMINLLKNEDWVIFVEGHASRGELSLDGNKDAYTLSAMRSMAVAKTLIQRGIHPRKITTVFYGDTRPDDAYENTSQVTDEFDRRVEFFIRKRDLRSHGHKVDSL